MRTLALAMCLILTATAIPAMSWSRDDLPTLASSSASGNAAWGARLDLTSASDTVIEVNVAGPPTSATIGAGAAIVDASGNPSFMFTFTGINSPDRVVGLPLSWGALPAGLHLTYALPQKTGQAGTDEACTFLCLALESDGRAAGTYYYVAWVAGGSGGSINVKGASGTVALSHGTATSAGDSDIKNGDVNIQYVSGGVGVKVMKGASTSFTAPGRTYGVCYDLNLKIVCAAVCLLPLESADYVASLGCGAALGMGCGNSVISMDGPAGHRGGSRFYALTNTASGNYKFNVDSKVDAFESGVSPFGCFGVCAGALLFEDFSILSAASVTIPA